MPRVVVRIGQSVSSTCRKYGYVAATVWDLPENNDARVELVKRSYAAKKPVTLILPEKEIGSADGKTGVPQRITLNIEDEIRCPWCKSLMDDCELAWDQVRGQHIGDGQKLARDMWKRKLSEHPWYTTEASLQAHHVICSEALNNDDWLCFSREFGYNINRKENGVMLPSEMPLACHIGVPLHRGNHENTKPNYPGEVSSKLAEVEAEIRNGDYCKADGCEKLRERLDVMSQDILDLVAEFDLPLTFAGDDYDPSVNAGCSGLTSVSDKQDENEDCDKGRRHGYSVESLFDRDRSKVALETNDKHIEGRK